ncbi:thioesterase domain-containing protein [Actinocrispum wychmicini]|uniref:Thioesterase domain-containing protein n=1 Tax=Actinocrispum wychmicini TaxID=1213861 RepID=A0A4R2JT77_9PSEU|nr:thioesterase domain-containing protein [Actinocrispum wychmicini]TCO62834.1 thioesterase domain-containing protein [Actinocrispum wychmicini]
MTGLATLAPTLTSDFDSLWNARTPSAQRGQCLVPVSPGSGSPVFCVHWGSGNIRFIRETTNRWSNGRPVLGFEAVGLYDNARPLLSVTEMADRYLRELLAAQPRGRYTLVGLCSGSHIAFEMARRLTAIGEEVDVLAVVNGVCPGVSVSRPEWELADIYELRLAGLRRDFGVADLDPHIPRIMADLKLRGWIDEDARREDFYPHQLLWATAAFAQEHYTTEPYHGPLHVFRSSDIRGPGAVPWTSVAPRAESTILDAADSVEVLKHSAFARLFA